MLNMVFDDYYLTTISYSFLAASLSICYGLSSEDEEL